MSCIPSTAKILDLKTLELTEESINLPMPGYVLIKVDTAILHPGAPGIEGVGKVILSGVRS